MPRQQDFRRRTLVFGRRVLDACTRPWALRHGPRIREQLRASATSIGANVEEARAGQSKRDFLNKMAIALKEARETLYWLRVMEGDTGSGDPVVADLTREADEIVAILTATVKTTRQRLDAEEARESAHSRARRRRA